MNNNWKMALYPEAGDYYFLIGVTVKNIYIDAQRGVFFRTSKHEMFGFKAIPAMSGLENLLDAPILYADLSGDRKSLSIGTRHGSATFNFAEEVEICVL